MAYSPVAVTNGTDTVLAETADALVQFLYDGWWPADAQPPASVDTFDLRVATRIGDVDSATRDALNTWGGGGGEGGGVSDHGALTGLGDDDHPQYLTESRGDARYLPASYAPPDGTTTTKGLVELATATETTNLTNGSIVVTPQSLKPLADSKAPAVHTHVGADLTDLTEVVQDIVAAFLRAGTNTTVTYDDVANTFTINATASGGGTTDPEIVRDTIGGALVAGAGIQITVNDAGDAITVASTAVLPTRQVTAGTGLIGGGDLSVDRTFAVAYGTTAGTAAQGNDSRLSDARTPTTHTHTASQISDASTAGRALLTAADVAAQRVALGVMPGVESSLTAYNAGAKTPGTVYFITS